MNVCVPNAVVEMGVPEVNGDPESNVALQPGVGVEGTVRYGPIGEFGFAGNVLTAVQDKIGWYVSVLLISSVIGWRRNADAGRYMRRVVGGHPA
jgi:hypothetical protein